MSDTNIVACKDLAPVAIVLQATPFCNISCSYCYLRDRSSRTTMSLHTLSKIFRELSALVYSPVTIRVIWHAGEPMVPGANWYRQSFELIAEATAGHLNVQHGMQTNGTLISDEWCDVIKTCGIDLGVSIDGPERIHDLNRQTRQGRGTYKQVMAGLKLLEKHGIDYGMICVVTDRSVECPEELFEFFCKLKSRSIGFNCEEKKGVNAESGMSSNNGAARYRTFLERFWGLARSSGDGWRIRDIDEIANTMLGVSNKPKYYSSYTFGKILSFTWDGRVSSFSPELLDANHPNYGDFILGNINEEPLRDILCSEKAALMRHEIEEGIENCKAKCEYFALCGGGDPCSKVFENGSFLSTETHFCRYTVKTPADLVLSGLSAQVAGAEA